jgi:hypothetical protein
MMTVVVTKLGASIGLASLFALAACEDPLTTSPSTSWNADARRFGTLVDDARDEPSEVAYGWALDATGDIVRWRECADEHACTDVARERAAGELLAVSHVGKTHVKTHVKTDGDVEVEVVRLTFKARPRDFRPAPKIRRFP